MRVLQVIHTFPPFSSAGSEIYALNLSKELANKMEVHVFYRFSDASKPEFLIERDSYDGIPVIRINNNFRHCDCFEKTYESKGVAEAFRNILDELKPDIVHFHHVTCLSMDLVEIAKTQGCGTIFTLHDYWLLCQRGQLLNPALEICIRPTSGKCVKCMGKQITLKYSKIEAFFGSLPQFMIRLLTPLRALTRAVEKRQKIRARKKKVKRLFRHTDMFLAPSRFLMGKFIKAGVKKNRIIYSDYGFDTSIFSGIRAKETGDKIIIGYIGTLIPSKGVHVLIKAFNEMNDEKCELWIYGGFSHFHGFENYATDLTDLAQGNTRIRFMGKYNNSSVADALEGVDIVVVPSIWYENSPLTIHEAFLAGKPVIVSGEGGMAELVTNGECGYHFSLGNFINLKDILEKIVSAPSELERLKKGIPAVKAISENAAEMEKLYSCKATLQ